MMSRYSKLISWLGLAFFIALGVSLLLMTTSVRDSRIQESQRVLNTLAPDIIGPPENRSKTINFLFREVPTLEALLYVNAAERVEVLWARNSELVQLPTDDGKSIPKILAPALNQALISLPAQTGGRIEGVFRVIETRDLFGIFRTGLISLLLFAGLTICLYVVAAFSATRKQVGKDNDPELEEADPAKPDLLQNEPDATNTDPQNLQAEPNIDMEITSEPLDDELSQFVSPEDELDDRLDNELQRAGGNEIDLSVGLFCLEEFQDGQEHSFFQVLKEHFVYRDMLYLNGNRACWVLLPYMGLDEAIRQAEAFTNRFNRSNPQASITVGLTSRNGRLVSHELIKKECRAALRKTSSKGDHIVGFRPDPDKYRRFLTRG